WVNNLLYPYLPCRCPATVDHSNDIQARRNIEVQVDGWRSATIDLCYHAPQAIHDQDHTNTVRTLNTNDSSDRRIGRYLQPIFVILNGRDEVTKRTPYCILHVIFQPHQRRSLRAPGGQQVGFISPHLPFDVSPEGDTIDRVMRPHYRKLLLINVELLTVGTPDIVFRNVQRQTRRGHGV